VNLQKPPAAITPSVFIVDDDDAVRLSLRMLLESADLQVEDFASAEHFLKHCNPLCCGCLITDLRMPIIDGLQLQSALTQRGFEIPIIILTGHADVSTAVKSLKAGAIDFLEKPFDPSVLLTQVHSAIELDIQRVQALATQHKNLAQLERLTPRELEVVERVCKGQSNKFIAIELGISDRTVELHRSRAMKKLRVRSVPDLVRLLADLSTAGLIQAQPKGD